jgi:putative ABC transport system permease protein
VKAGVRRVLLERHDGEEDFTITTQTEMLDVLDRILSAVTLAVGGIAAVSLLVGAIGILTMMWISVGERTSEIRLARAIGAGSGQILRIFLIEAALLSLVGGALGVALGVGAGGAVLLLLPSFPFTPGRASSCWRSWSVSRSGWRPASCRRAGRRRSIRSRR